MKMDVFAIISVSTFWTYCLLSANGRVVFSGNKHGKYIVGKRVLKVISKIFVSEAHYS